MLDIHCINNSLCDSVIRVSFFSSVYVAYNFLRFLTRSFNLFKWCFFGFFFFSRFLYARMCFLLSQCTILPIKSDVAYILRSRMIFRPSSVRFLFARNRFMHFWDLSFCFFKSSEIQVIWNSNNVNEILTFSNTLYIKTCCISPTHHKRSTCSYT